MRHILRVADTFLEDHAKAFKRSSEFNYWERVLLAKASGDDSLIQQHIPSYLTPDKDRGVEYSDEIIEMKGKISLHPKMKSPQELYGNMSFDHSTDSIPLNMVGTIREQYSWQPTLSPEEHEIDPKVVKIIGPVIQFANHMVVLQHAKDGLIIFEYKGLMRNLIGIRDMMKGIARDCYPEFVDLRLETVKTSDKFDHS